eukprot:6637217-Alexandrium_andersonii.AAC.1
MDCVLPTDKALERIAGLHGLFQDPGMLVSGQLARPRSLSGGTGGSTAEGLPRFRRFKQLPAVSSCFE